MAFDSLEKILETCRRQECSFGEAVLREDMYDREVSREASEKQMQRMWEAMKQASMDYDGNLKSRSGLVGGDGAKMADYTRFGNNICGSFMGEVMAAALQMGESNARMKRIVAAPTAGACGVLLAVLVPWWRHEKGKEEKMLEALYVAAGIGQVIASRAYIAGASGGCQAEIGTASAMAAGAMTFLHGGNAEQIVQAAAMALKNLMGLVCDPVAGLVEVPCVKRNVIGAVNACACADMALCGMASRIPADQVIDAMKEVGDKMDDSLKETGRGGVAGTPAGCEIREAMEAV